MQTLLKGKLAFSADGQWCTMVQLLGLSATIRAQLLQIEQSAAGSAKAAAKKNKGKLAKLNKAKYVLALYN